MSEIDKVAWILIEDGRVLSTRSRGKDVWYLPGGKREPGETDLQTLRREIDEELSVEVDVRDAVHLGTFTAQAHGHAAGVTVRMTCYRAGYEGRLRPANEIAETAWLEYADRHRTSAVDQIIFDHLRATGLLR
ncbi:NUDIX domain-containing protein [Micromonospora sp. ALFpr18c]|uniref:NUDIX hydrolase n=1 Tax=unclassified Micromonospora TaxID=2617518 RepID=UPI00124B3345|nr:NUDIX domain-containing protein [Micromonospora sp. ALFpr18c]KAB1947174.1 NUDIX domain-containing protein [Micromonospora sp. ALFpr18c]